MQPIALTEEKLNRLFPFYIVLNDQLQIISCGSSLQKVAAIGPGLHLSEAFDYDKSKLKSGAPQEVAGSYHQIVTRKNDSFNNPIVLQGEFEYFEDIGQLLFLGTPIISRNKEEISDKPLRSYYSNTITNKDNNKAHEAVEENEAADGHMITGIAITDAKGAIEWVSKDFERTSGYLLHEIAGMRPREVVYGKDSVHIPSSYVDEMVKKKKTFSFDNIGYNRRKKSFWFRTTVHPILDSASEVKGRYYYFEDVTAIKNKEQALSSSMEMWKFAVDGAGDGAWSLLFQTGEFEASERFKELLRIDKNKKVSLRDIIKLLGYSQASAIYKFLKELRDNLRSSFNQECRVIFENGEERYFRIRGAMTNWHNSTLVSAFGTLDDITEERVKDLALKQYSSRLSALVGTIGSGILFEDEFGGIAMTNEAFCKIFGIPVSHEQLKGLPCSEQLAGLGWLFTDIGAFASRVQEIISEKLSVSGEIIELTDGRVLTLDTAPVYIEKTYVGRLWNYSDITDQKKMEREIISQRQYYNNILDELPAEVVVFSPDHKYKFLNRKCIRDAEVRKWIIDKDDYEYFRSKGRDTSAADKRRALFDQAIATRQPASFIDKITDENGNNVYVIRIFNPLLDEGGNVKYVIGYGTDITEQVENKEMAELRSAQWQELLGIITDGVFSMAYDGSVLVYNRSFSRILNINRQGKDDSEMNFFDFLENDDRITVQQMLDALRREGRSDTHVLSIPDKEGNGNRSLEIVLSINPDKTILGRISDITEIINKEKTLQSIIAREKGLNASKTQFIRVTSHELRTPLAIIQANAEILEIVFRDDSGMGASMDKNVMLSRITREVKRMTELLNELMLVSRIESGSINFSPQTQPLRPFLEELIADLYQPYYDGRTLEWDMENDIGFVEFDDKLLRHALVNILNNAFKYSIAKRPPVMRVYRDKTNERIVFEVKDFGIGIPQEDQDKVFTPFFRASNASGIQGTGLGLMVLDYVISKHKGTVDFNSKINEGTTFLITISYVKSNGQKKGIGN